MLKTNEGYMDTDMKDPLGRVDVAKTKPTRITRKTLLYKSGVEYAGYALNHVEGCTHGCTYPCYAMMLKKRCGAIASYEDWIRPKIVSNALELLDKELPRLKDKIKQVFLCFTTDPFMYEMQEVQDLTLEILKRLKQARTKAILISKGIYPDELLDRAVLDRSNEYGSTIVTLSEDFRKRFEPHATPIDQRISALRKLHEAGLKTWISIEPYPTPNVIKQDIREILQQVSFVDRIVFGKWNYSKQTSTFIRYREFYNSMSHEVIKFCNKNSIDVHIKEGSINLDCLTHRQVPERALLAKHA